MMQPQASLVFRLSYEVVSIFISKSHCSDLQRCFTAALLWQNFAVHEMWRSLLEWLAKTTLQTLKRCATVKVYRCSTAAALRRSYGKFLVQIRAYINPSSPLRKFYHHVVMETTVLVKSSLCHSVQTTQCRTLDIVLVLNAQTFAIAKLSQEGNAVKFDFNAVRAFSNSTSLIML